MLFYLYITLEKQNFLSTYEINLVVTVITKKGRGLTLTGHKNVCVGRVVCVWARGVGICWQVEIAQNKYAELEQVLRLS